MWASVQVVYLKRRISNWIDLLHQYYYYYSHNIHYLISFYFTCKNEEHLRGRFLKMSLLCLIHFVKGDANFCTPNTDFYISFRHLLSVLCFYNHLYFFLCLFCSRMRSWWVLVLYLWWCVCVCTCDITNVDYRWLKHLPHTGGFFLFVCIFFQLMSIQAQEHTIQAYEQKRVFGSSISVHVCVVWLKIPDFLSSAVWFFFCALQLRTTKSAVCNDTG